MTTDESRSTSQELTTALVRRELAWDELIGLMRELATVPVIASGGAGRAADFPPAVGAGADAVLAASVFHDGILTVAEVKAGLADAGYEVRNG